MTNAFVSKTTTYPQLSDALTHLGFLQRVTPQFTAFRNAQFDALIILPQDALGGQVRPLHMAAARATVIGKGVATAAEFDRLLLQVRRKSAAPDVSPALSAGKPPEVVLQLPSGLAAVRPKRGTLAARAARTVGAKKRAKTAP